MRLPIAAEGWPFILGMGSVALLLVLFRLWPAASAALLLTLFMAFFFRDPERAFPKEENLILSPADGKVIEVVPLSGGGTRVSIFLSIFDVHVNRIPCAGVVEEIERRRGRFLAAWDARASEENERCGIVLETPGGKVRVVQVAGLVARRIVCRLEKGQTVRRGERYGHIRFGSRVDLHLPAAAEVSVRRGDRVRGGADAVARWR